MPRRRPPCSGETPSLAMAMRMRFRAFFVISTAALARGCWPSAVSSVIPAKGSFEVSAEAPGLGAVVPGWSRVDIELVRVQLPKEHHKACDQRYRDCNRKMQREPTIYPRSAITTVPSGGVGADQ